MIPTRIKPYHNPTGREYEYYSESLDKWDTLVNWTKYTKGKISQSALYERIKNKHNNPDYRTFDGCLFSPKITNRIGRKNRLRELNFNEWVEINKLFKPKK